MAIVKFDDVVVRANTKEDRFNTERLYYVGGEHIESNEVTIQNRGLIEGSTIGPMFYFGFKAGQVLFVTRNPHLRKAGWVDFDGICSEKTFVLETKDENVLCQRFLPFILQSDHFWDYCEANKSGSVNFFVNWSTLAKYEFELPDIETQRKLAEVLWAMERTKQAYKRLISATNELVKSQFIEMFGNPLTNERGWRSALFPEVTDIALGSTPKSSEPAFWDGDIGWITPAEIEEDSFIINDSVRHITEAGVKNAGLKPFPEGTVIFTTRAPIGKTAIAGGEMYCNQGFKNFVCHPELNPVYLFSLLRIYKDYFIGLGTGATFKELSKARIEKISISVPPIGLQNEYEVFYRQTDKSKFELTQALEALNATYKKLISENLG